VKLVIGLGNPGAQYELTRHNVGFRVVDELARRASVELTVERFHGWFACAEIRGERLVLLKPTTFMNRSGQCVLAAGRFYKAELDDVMIIVDDHALSLGRLRIRKSGSAGGHNGMKDIERVLGTNVYARLRIGIDPPLGSMSSYVLARFSEDEEMVIRDSVVRAADAVECWLAEGIDASMNRYNPPADGG
jgi:PTH1 family peptidyl-tRNA hydrolase